MHDVDLSSAPLINEEGQMESSQHSIADTKRKSVPKPVNAKQQPRSGRWVRRDNQIILIDEACCMHDGPVKNKE